MNITLIGMKHCGKTTLGKALAARWQCPFYDVDRMIEEYHACEDGNWLSVREIFSTRGEGRFHELETHVVCELYLRLNSAKESNVIAVGGRTALNAKVNELLGGIGLIVYLEVSPDELWTRVLRTGVPPFVNEKDPAAHFQELYRERAPHYQRLANLIVNLDGLGPDAALEKLCRSINEHTTKTGMKDEG